MHLVLAWLLGREMDGEWNIYYLCLLILLFFFSYFVRSYGHSFQSVFF